MRMRTNGRLSLILFAALLQGCAGRPGDEQIQKDIQIKVAAEPEGKDSDIAVLAEHGKVTLKGKVRTESARNKLESIAKNEPGVVEVNDETSIEEYQPAA